MPETTATPAPATPTSLTTLHDRFLLEACADAKAAGHIFPEYAAAESALESAWGLSQLALKANNLFGQKQSHPPLPATTTLTLPTREFLHGHWVSVSANWVQFPSWEACFAARMALLRHLAASYPAYQEALAAVSGPEFITKVSKSWSTDPERAGKVLSIYDAHQSVFGGGQ
jgi:flagellum-specific peptidoglycan hydrolase FlgJ